MRRLGSLLRGDYVLLEEAKAIFLVVPVHEVTQNIKYMKFKI